MLSLQIWK